MFLQLSISSMFVTHHGLDKFEGRRFSLPLHQIDCYIIHQLRKGNEFFKTPRLKMAFQILEDRFAICDVFENRKTGDIVVKMLTTLSKEELSVSRNLDCGKVLKNIKIKFSGVSVKEEYLDERHYICDILKEFLTM